MTVYTSEHLGFQQGRLFPNELSVLSPNCFAKDHMLALWVNPRDTSTGSYRGESAEFVSCQWLYCDIDNTHSEDPGEWISIDGFADKYRDFSYTLYTSRNHGKEKIDSRGVTRAARPKYHVLFPLPEPLKDLGRFSLLLKTLAYSEAFIDRATDTKRFYFGNPDSIVRTNIGTESIVSYLEALPCCSTRSGKDHTRVRKTGAKLADDGSILSELQKCAEEGYFDTYDEWIQIGMALKTEGFALDDWHQLSWGDVDVDDCRKHWVTFGEGGITGGTIFHIIRERNPEFRRTVDLDEERRRRLIWFVNRKRTQ